MNHYPIFLYIDPGTGGMLFTILFAAVGALYYAARSFFIKFKFMLGGGRAAGISEDKIPIAIFSDHKRYFNIFEPICEEMERRGVNLTYLAASEDDPIFSKDYQHIKSIYLGEGNKAFSKLNLLNATILLSTTPSLDVFQWKRSKDVDYYVHIPHAASDINMYRMFGIDSYDAILLSGEYQRDEVRKLEELRHLAPKEIELVGIPYMDEMKKRLEAAEARDGQKELKKPKGPLTVLLAPSWGESGILARYGERLIDALIDTGYHIIVRPHPQSFTSEEKMMERLMEKYNDPDVVEWNRDNDNFEVLRLADILISDFSGVMFDYALVFDKPIIYTQPSYDRSPYDCAWTQDPLWTFEILPKLGMELDDDKIPNIKEFIDECLQNPIYQEGRALARRQTWVYEGEGTKKTVSYLLEKYKILSQKDTGASRKKEEVAA